MKNFELQGIKSHEDAVKFWSKIPWHLSNQEIEKISNRDYTTIALKRKIYAPLTITPKFRKNWKCKIQKLINGELKYIVARNFVEQAGARVAGYALGKKLKQSRKNRFIYLKIKE